jgi:glycine/D-amino acid oxidase-like deaminating enzyme/nitrite reductase/ring-hydroxylating ferredoxin subunit
VAGTVTGVSPPAAVGEPVWDATWAWHEMLVSDSRVDVVVVGAGLTGSVAALRLAAAGLSVAVLTASPPSRSTTALSTGKVSLLQGERLAQIRERHGDEVLMQYVEVNRAGMDWIVGQAQPLGVPLEIVDDVTVAYDANEVPRLERVFEAAARAGLGPVRAAHGTPRGAVAAVRVPAQVQVNPSALLSVLHARLAALGVHIYQGARVRAVRRGREPAVVTDEATVTAQHVLLATGAPFGRLGALFARVGASRSYLTAWRSHDEVLATSIGFQGGSVRTAGSGDDAVVLVGGQGHTVGQGGSVARRFELLSDWARAHVGASERLAAWGAQDYVSASRLPLVGRVLPGERRVLAATGYGKWGLTNGAAAGLALADAVLDAELQPWAEVLDPWGAAHAADVPGSLRLTTSAVATIVGGWGGTLTRPEDAPRADGGAVCRMGAVMVARSRVDGRRRSVSAVCPHMGGIVAWNDAERSWDCPVHGSRFGSEGAVLEGPATKPLRSMSPDTSPGRPESPPPGPVSRPSPVSRTAVEH